MRGRVALTAVLWLVLAAGCASQRLSLSALPASPIAVTYWSGEDSRRRAELLDERQEVRSRRGIAAVSDLGALVREDTFDSGSELLRYPGRLVLLDPSTKEIRPIESAPPGARALSWSDDRQRLLFTSSRSTGRFQLYELDVASGDVRAITYGTRQHPAGTFGPDGRVAFGSLDERDGSYEGRLWVTGPHAGTPAVLSTDRIVESLCWSPGGETLVYVTQRTRMRSGRPQVERVLVARSPEPGADEKVLGPGRDPAFTPDGELIVYSGPDRGEWRLRRMRPDGSGRAPVGGSARSELTPAVSPDGEYVAYVSQEGGYAHLYVRRMDGSGDRILLEDGTVMSPVW